jgi:hypothetical protein
MVSFFTASTKNNYNYFAIALNKAASQTNTQFRLDAFDDSIALFKTKELNADFMHQLELVVREYVTQ